MVDKISSCLIIGMFLALHSSCSAAIISISVDELQEEEPAFDNDMNEVDDHISKMLDFPAEFQNQTKAFPPPKVGIKFVKVG